MKPTSITRNNHYVPCIHLKRFASRPGWIYRYDLLVPNANCPVWVEKPIDRVASASDLYTSVENGEETDSHERWLNSEYETPAEEAIDRAVTGRPMTKEHWRRLVRFVAAQDVRTPARLYDEVTRWRGETSETIQSLVEESIAEWQAAKRDGRTPREPEATVEPGFPVRVRIRPSHEHGMAEIRTEMVSGRSRWLWGQRHILKGVAQRLHEHQWSILTAPEHVSWPATDNPVIRLNFHNDRKYDFNGGWGSPGTEIFMPLNPKHMVYTRIGQKRPPRETELESRMGETFRRFFAEHAFRHIFSPFMDDAIPQLRPRHVDLEAYQNEKAQWARWSQEQADAELDLNRPLPDG